MSTLAHPRSFTPASLALRGLQVAAMNTLLAGVFASFGAFSLTLHLVYAQCIGLAVWALFELLGRFGTGWPRWLQLLALVFNVVAGYAAGSLLADALTGHSTRELWRAAPQVGRGALIATLLASLLALAWFFSRERLAHSHAQAEEARRQAAEAQLRLLQSQLEPHMLFNTLATLRALIAVDTGRAQEMLDSLNAYLRATLAASRTTSHPLSAEFGRLADYLALMQVRMGERLQLRLDLPPELAAQPIPPLLLQPLVENAIRHGLEPARGGGCLRVSAYREGELLVLDVLDTGVGLLSEPSADPTKPGFGLQQVRERLATQYGHAASLSLAPALGGGTLARVRLPLQAAHLAPLSTST